MFSPLIWQASSDTVRSICVFLLFILLSFVYLTVCSALSSRSGEKKDKVLGIISLIYFLISFSASSLMLDISVGPQLSLIALGIMLLYVQLVILIMLFGGWFAKHKHAPHALSLHDYLRTNFWLTNLSYSLIFIPLIVLGIEMINSTNKTIYGGNILFAVGLTFLAIKSLISGSFTVFRLEVQHQNLPESLKTKYLSAIQPLDDLDKHSIRLLRQGFRNALAVKSTNTIFLGVDLLHFLTAEEIRAVALHELGHLKDKRYIPMLRKILFSVVVLYFALQLSSQSGLLSPWTYCILFFVGLFVFLQVVRKIRLKSEFVADSFVKDFSTEAHGHLLTGIKKLQELNQVDKDFCKKKNYAHLDLDERAKMVSEGKFGTQRKSFVRSALTFIGVMTFVFCLQLGYQSLPSSKNEWRKLHNQYHDLYTEEQYPEAQAIINKAYHFAKSHFGSVHYRTYLSTNDASVVSLALDEITAAERFAEDAVDLGHKLFKENDKRQIRSLRNLIAVYYEQDRAGETEQLYAKILRIQKRTNARPSDMISTLLALIQHQARLKESQKLKTSMNELLSVYNSLSVLDEDELALYELFAFLYDSPEILSKQSISHYIAKLGEITRLRFGAQSLAYATFLAEAGYYHESMDDYTNAKKSYAQCIERFKSIGMTNREDYHYCLFNQGAIAQKEKEYELARNLFQESMQVSKQINGEDTFDIKYEIMRIADIFAEQANNEDAIRYYKRVIRLEERDPNKDRNHLLHGYTALLTLLNHGTNESEISQLQEKIASLKKEHEARLNHAADFTE